MLSDTINHVMMGVNSKHSLHHSDAHFEPQQVIITIYISLIRSSCGIGISEIICKVLRTFFLGILIWTPVELMEKYFRWVKELNNLSQFPYGCHSYKMLQFYFLIHFKMFKHIVQNVSLCVWAWGNEWQRKPSFQEIFPIMLWNAIYHNN